MYAWLVKKVGSLVARLIVALIVIGLLFAGYNFVKQFFTAGLKTEVELGRNKGEAAVQSGSDAVETVSGRAASDQEALDSAEETKDEIAKQTGAGGVTSAGRRGLCDRSPDRSGCRSVQRTAPR